MVDGAVTLADIEAARRRIEGSVRLTPMLHSSALSERLGFTTWLKCENLQRTGSFKPRGAGNMLAATIEASGRPAGVVAASAGNHAQGVALAASRLGIQSTVLMPRDAPLAKRLATEGYGASVVLVDGPLSECIEQAYALADERQWLFVPPFDHPLVVAGQGTLGLEVLEQAPTAETVMVPAGGGGLLAGVAVAVKTARPGVRVVGVQTGAMPGIVASRQAGAPTQVPASRTIADGVGVAGPSSLTFDLIERYVDDLVTVTEEEIALAIVTLIERTRLVVEGAGALTVAALLSGAVRDSGETVAVISGGNIDVNLLGRIVGRGMLASGRHRTLTVAAANVPGEMARITGVLASAGANIVAVEQDRSVSELPVSVSRITFRLEVAGPEAFARLMSDLETAGLRPGTVTDLVTVAAWEMPL